MTDQELKDLVASNAKGLQELKVFQREVTEQMKLTSEQMKRTDEQMKRTDEQMKLTGEQIKRTDEQMKRTDEKLERMGIRLGNIQQNNGDIAEEFFFNTLDNSMKLGKISYDDISRNIHRHKKKQNIQGEYDLLLVNGNSVAILETKYKAHLKDVKKFIENDVPKFKKLFPEYEKYKLYAGIASFYVNKSIRNYADEKGFYIVERKGDSIETTSDKNIKTF